MIFDYIPIVEMVACLSMTCMLALYIWFVYRFKRQKAENEYADRKKTFSVVYMQGKTIFQENFKSLNAMHLGGLKFLLVEIDEKEFYLVIGSHHYEFHFEILDFFKTIHSSISNRSWFMKKPNIRTYGGGKIYYNPEENRLVFFHKSMDFGRYNKLKLEKVSQQIKEKFAVNEIGYSKSESWR